MFEDSRKLLDALFHNAKGSVLIRFLKGRNTFVRFFPNINAVDWREVKQRNQDGFDVYFNVCPREGKKAGKQGVIEVTALWCDLDGRDFPGGKEEALSRISQLPTNLAPSVIIDSGHGYHVYWLLDQPIPIKAIDVAAIEGYIAGLARFLGGDAVQDLSRLLRMPGTINWKTEPIECRIVSFNPERRFQLSDFQPYWIAAGHGIVEEITFSAELPDIDVEDTNITERMKDLAICGFHEGCGYKSRSEADQAVITALVAGGHGDDEIKAIFLKHAIGERYLERGDWYLGLSIANARAYLASRQEGNAMAVRATVKALSEADFLESLELDGFLKNYIASRSKGTDAPLLFHAGVGLTLVATMLEKRVSFEAWGNKVFPHLWIVLVAPSAAYRKTWAIKLGVRLLERIANDLLFPEDFTRERFLDLLSEQSSGLIVQPEFAQWLSVMVGRDYLKGLKEMLTAFYDSPTKYERQLRDGSGTLIQEPVISILAATTVDWLQAHVGGDDFRSGFMSRFLFLPVSEKQGWRGLATQKVTDDRLSMQLLNLRKVAGHISMAEGLDAETLGIYDKWLEEHEHISLATPELEGFYSRCGIHVLKLAILFEAASTGGITPTKKSMNQAIKFIEYVKQAIRGSLFDALTFTAVGKELHRLLEILRKNGGDMPRRDLLRYSNMRVDYFGRCIDTLVQRGEIEEFTPSGRKQRRIRLTELSTVEVS